MKRLLILLVAAVLVAAAAAAAFLVRGTGNGELPPIKSFQDCLAAGLPIMESYPRQCQAPDGTLHVEDIGNELEKLDLIRIDSPRPNAVISSPLEIRGKARGTWYFEADFPIRLLDAEGNEIAVAIAQAQGDWMTEEFVPFQASLTFTAPGTPGGVLVLQKDNPSGLPENDDELVVPVLFAAP
jgi:opacity protein-like surface antigen